MKNRYSIRWREIASEFLAITFGVVLGMWVSDWQNDRDRNERGEQMRDSLISELAANYNQIESSRTYHLDILPGIVAARNAIAANQDYEPVAYRGFQTVPNRTAAYSTALATGAFADFGPLDSEPLITAYSAIDYLRTSQERHLTTLATIGSNNARFFDLLSFAFSDMLFAEDRALAAIGSAIGREPPPNWRSQTTTDPYSMTIEPQVEPTEDRGDLPF